MYVATSEAFSERATPLQLTGLLVALSGVAGFYYLRFQESQAPPLISGPKAAAADAGGGAPAAYADVSERRLAD